MNPPEIEDYHILSGFDPDDYPSNKVAVAMSGGIDSSLAAVMLRERGFEVVGLTMLLWDYERCGGRGNRTGCCDLASIEHARGVAYDAGIPHYVTNMKEEFERIVIDDFVESYLSGKTPNPCVVCNTEMKWKLLLKKARALGCGLIATGHYARIGRGPEGNHALLKGSDPAKDQSYFLWGIDRGDLAHTLFPLGAMTKKQTRAESAKRGLKTADRPESFEICFIPDNDYRRFLIEKVGDSNLSMLREGDILDRSGAVVGRHTGAAFYTLGQRRGIGGGFARPVYVTGIDVVRNTITIGDASDLLSFRMSIGGMNWFQTFPESGTFPCTAKIRSMHPGAEALAAVRGNSVEIEFREPQSAVTPGQSAVLYDGDRVIGGGIIE